MPARAFWVEAFGGRPYRVERQKNPEPIIVPRLAVSVYGSVQPDRLGPLMREADDGLLARSCGPGRTRSRSACRAVRPNRHGRSRRSTGSAGSDLQPGDPRSRSWSRWPASLALLEEFAQGIQERQASAGGLMRSALGKARGLALRLSLVIELLWWCGQQGMAPAPTQISARAFAAAAHLIDDYFMPMADRVYGDAAASPGTGTPPRWPAGSSVRASRKSVRRCQRPAASARESACPD